MTNRIPCCNYVGPILAAAVFCCAIVVGCQSKLEVVPVHGKVLYQGKPLEYGSVMFQPEGDGPLARGTIQPDGTFVLGTESESDGVRPGKSRVRVTAFEAQKAGAKASTGQELALGRSAIPPRYQSFGTSEIVVEVTPDIELPLIIELN